MAFSYAVEEGSDKTLCERGNDYISFRKIRWGDNEEKPFKPDLRKYRIGNDGSECMLKGITFPDDDAVDEVVSGLAEIGYGKTLDLINAIKGREDFMDSLVSCLNDDELEKVNVDPTQYNREDYYDPRTSLFVVDDLD